MLHVITVNQSAKAKKKLTGIAKSSGLPFYLVDYLFSFHWNFDGREGAWVYERDLLQDEEYSRRYNYLSETLNLPEMQLSRQEVVYAVYRQLGATDEATLLNNFISGAAMKDYCRVSRFASYWYLQNATVEKLETLEWTSIGFSAKQIVDTIFFKVFRGGAIERYNLEYLYTDLVCRLPWQQTSEKATNWLKDFLDELTAVTTKPTLLVLRNMLKQYINGNKHFLQTVLEALSYAGYLKVPGHPVNEIFIPDYRNELSGHFNTNEWMYPLRFW